MEIVAGELELYTDELLVSDGKRGEGLVNCLTAFFWIAIFMLH